MGSHNRFAESWDGLVEEHTLPTRFRDLHEIAYEDFRQKVTAQDPVFVEEITRSLYQGDGYLIREAFPKEFIEKLKDQVFEHCKKSPSSFHKMLEEAPDFHRMIDEEAAKKYSFKAIKHSCYFYPWNDDPFNLFKLVWERWGLVKFLSGQRIDEFEKNTPKDGVIDRIQVVQYPSGAGMLETHSDPYLHQRTILSGFMSKRGVDFETGGFYVIGQDDERIDLEDRIEVGDVMIAYATVLHGVEVVDSHREVDWNSMRGRWFLSMYSNVSDEVKDRHTGYAVRLKGEQEEQRR
jgi:hypothetical protein